MRYILYNHNSEEALGHFCDIVILKTLVKSSLIVGFHKIFLSYFWSMKMDEKEYVIAD